MAWCVAPFFRPRGSYSLVQFAFRIGDNASSTSTSYVHACTIVRNTSFIVRHQTTFCLIKRDMGRE